MRKEGTRGISSLGVLLSAARKRNPSSNLLNQKIPWLPLQSLAAGWALALPVAPAPFLWDSLGCAWWWLWLPAGFSQGSEVQKLIF